MSSLSPQNPVSLILFQNLKPTGPKKMDHTIPNPQVSLEISPRSCMKTSPKKDCRTTGLHPCRWMMMNHPSNFGPSVEKLESSNPYSHPNQLRLSSTSYPLISLISPKYYSVLYDIALQTSSIGKSVHARSHTPVITILPCSSATPYVPGSSSLRSMPPLHIEGNPFQVLKDSMSFMLVMYSTHACGCHMRGDETYASFAAAIP